MRSLLVVIGTLLLTCTEPITYECDGWEKRECACPDGQEGTQRCSRGQPFGDPVEPRIWQHCSCCFVTKEDQHGVYRYETDPDSGCWGDSYNPASTDSGGEE